MLAGRSRFLDGKTEIELPSRKATRVFWDADILDLDDKNKADTIIGTEETFGVRFASNSGAGCGAA